jgi:hypothetical protein
MRGFVIVVSAATIVACTATPKPRPASADPGLTPASYQASSGTLTPTLCTPKIVDGRAELSDDCVNVIDGSPSAGRQIHAIGRETQQLRSLCDNLVLPKCRRKY